MDNISLVQLIQSSLKYYDDQNIKYIQYIKTNSISFEPDLNTGFIKLNDREFDYEILGYFDNQNNVWIWGWVLSDLSYERTRLCKELLNYGLKLEPSSNSLEHYIIKSLLLNSRILLEEYVQLETYLAIVSYIIKDKILFIYPRKRYLDDKNISYVTVYYFIKKI
jgi:hypothetical protein